MKSRQSLAGLGHGIFGLITAVCVPFVGVKTLQVVIAVHVIVRGTPKRESIFLDDGSAMACMKAGERINPFVVAVAACLPINAVLY